MSNDRKVTDSSGAFMSEIGVNQMHGSVNYMNPTNSSVRKTISTPSKHRSSGKP